MLNYNNDGLAIFSNGGITVDETLPKYTKIKDEKKNDVDANRIELSNPFMGHELIDIKRGETFEQFETIDVHDMNVYLDEHEYKHLMSGGKFKLNNPSGSTFINAVPTPVEIVTDDTNHKKTGFIKRLFGKKKEEPKPEPKIDHYEFDVVSFFAEIKKLAKLNKEAYANRVKGYIEALKAADIAGQETLKEKLLQGLVINKYESLLYATGNYYAIDEQSVVEFAKKSEKGVALSYVKHFLRPIPLDVLTKIKEMNELEIFDNYVVMYYDPEHKFQEKTHSEKVKEEAKRRDPILFGVIAGSNKLYYITDWIDEYCNLTLDEFIKVLQVEKEQFNLGEKAKI